MIVWLVRSTLSLDLDLKIGSTRSPLDVKLSNIFEHVRANPDQKSKFYRRLRQTDRSSWQIVCLLMVRKVSDTDLLAYEQHMIDYYRTIEYGLNVDNPFPVRLVRGLIGYYCSICDVQFETNCAVQHQDLHRKKPNYRTDRTKYLERMSAYRKPFDERKAYLEQLISRGLPTEVFEFPDQIEPHRCKLCGYRVSSADLIETHECKSDMLF